MLFLVLFMTVYSSSYGEETNCDLLGVNYYEELGCTPRYATCHSKCPSYFNCPKLEPAPGYCLIAGKNYSDGDIVTAGMDSCHLCNCASSRNNELVCVEPQCSYDSVLPPCHKKKDFKVCCGTEIICPVATSARCEANGIFYYEGAIFVPEGKCWECICQKGFKKNVYEAPYCRRRPCNLWSLRFPEIQKKCAPVYLKITGKEPLCCPFTFMCPEDIVEVNVIKSSTTKRSKKCVLGNRTFMVDEEFMLVSTTTSAICKCEIPPLPTCIQKLVNRDKEAM